MVGSTIIIRVELSFKSTKSWLETPKFFMAHVYTSLYMI